ncbi:MAG TPA: bifunctional RNase H/acid phosphatase [Actinomycetaceae bacterium]|nr:bifunctional RNase H/acid phosphatase [Actinomycetaceae bacterium]
MRYIVNTDGGSRGNPGPAGYGFVVADDDGHVLLERAGFLGSATNNVAEYMAVVAALEAIAEEDPSADVMVRADSKLVVEQLSGRWKIKNAGLIPLAGRARKALPGGTVRYEWVPRAKNSAADALANRAMDNRKDFSRGEIPAVAAKRESAPPSNPATAASSSMPVRSPVRSPVPNEPVTLVFMRHGVTTMTESGEYSGGSVPGPSLSPLGLEQAKRAAETVARLDEIWEDIPLPSVLWASPMVRTRETAAAIARHLGQTAEAVPDLREGDFGDWEGLTSAEIDSRWPGMRERWHHDAKARPPGGESYEDVGKRIRRVVDRALAEHAGKTIVLVCHNLVVRSGIGSIARIDPNHWYDIRVPPASISIARVWPNAHELVVAGLPVEASDSSDTRETLF